MVVKVKEKIEKASLVKNNDKFQNYTLRGERNVRHHDRILSNRTKLSIFFQRN